MEARGWGYVCQSGVGGGEIGGKVWADSLGGTSLALRGLRRQRHFWICFGVKDKRAAQGRRSGNHCGRHKIPRKISGNAGAGVQTEAAEALSLFIRLREFCAWGMGLSRGEVLGSVMSAMGMFQQVRLKTKCGGTRRNPCHSVVEPYWPFADLPLFLQHLYRALASFCGVVLYPAALAFKFGCARTGANIESFAALGSGLCQHCS